jgi:hypothetical protein
MSIHAQVAGKFVPSHGCSPVGGPAELKLKELAQSQKQKEKEIERWHGFGWGHG